jgi:hypothetical protein
MTVNMLISPDFAPEHFPGWYLLSTTLQHRSHIHLHLLMPADAKEQALLIREYGYLPFARPRLYSNEMVIATAADASQTCVEDLEPGCSIALTDNRDVKLIGLRLLEPADLQDSDINWVNSSSYQNAARLVINGQVNAGFFLASAYHSLSRLTHERMKILIESRLRDISHVFLAHPRIADNLPRLQDALLGISPDAPSDLYILQSLGLPDGFETMTQEDAEFMIDLMDTLLD